MAGLELAGRCLELAGLELAVGVWKWLKKLGLATATPSGVHGEGVRRDGQGWERSVAASLPPAGSLGLVGDGAEA